MPDESAPNAGGPASSLYEPPTESGPSTTLRNPWRPSRRLPVLLSPVSGVAATLRLSNQSIRASLDETQSWCLWSFTPLGWCQQTTSLPPWSVVQGGKSRVKSMFSGSALFEDPVTSTIVVTSNCSEPCGCSARIGRRSVCPLTYATRSGRWPRDQLGQTAISRGCNSATSSRQCRIFVTGSGGRTKEAAFDLLPGDYQCPVPATIRGDWQESHIRWMHDARVQPTMEISN
ncbi:uncharacterized protein BO80DRAFT_78983 [Aspergillus ibericus CBS 121593]|uniref:Uncharacterized protein n=1 Tax=Aspergillus ibericus CBS 121593 TaxID=1448316 RepID=A0A395HDA1_9EURO|nr:hypothetical protein BO80DRAFT_78983 [Aspergillus ibericus CBS 121593]RAL05710.1 hypothetical protein BO80DRAFT_78983 [Aspergillus ibericus CBS 121593]